VKLGVQQALATTPGGQYLLSFYVGNFSSATAPVQLDVNGSSVGTFTNTMSATYPSYNGDGVAGMSWQQFTYDFTATGASTTIAFYNLAAGGVLANGLDDVSVNSVPEPPTAVLLLTGVGSLLVVCRQVAGAKPSRLGLPSRVADV